MKKVDSTIVGTIMQEKTLEEAIFAGGCFWGVEYYMQRIEGVLKVESGYIGGRTENPSYEDVCRNDTGHIEAVRIQYNPALTNYETLTKAFFEIHDPTQTDGQGPDLGEQYLSVVFYLNDDQKRIATEIINELRNKGFNVVTELRPATTFWVAEDYHQNYYNRKGTLPYCHGYVKRF